MADDKQPDNQNEQNQANNAQGQAQSAPREDIDNVKAVSAIAYLGILFFVPMLTNPKSKFAMFHANQGLLLLISSTVMYIVAMILTFVTLGILFFLPFLVWIFVLVLFIMGLVNALNGEMKRLPLVGQWDLIKPQS